MSKPEWTYSESPAIEQCKKMGYDFKTRKELYRERESLHDVLIPQRFKTTIRKINTPWLSEDDANEVLRQLKKFDTTSPLETNEIAYAKMVGISKGHLKPITIKQDRGDGMRPHTIKLFDFDSKNPFEKNDFLVTNQFKLSGYKEDIIPDIVLFVNGMPVVIIECKSPELFHPISDAINGNLKRYQMRHAGFDQLFHYNQIIVACCGTKAKYAPTFGKPYHYKDWNDSFPLTASDVKKQFGDSRKQEILFAGMFEPRNLLNILRNFVVYGEAENMRIKKIAMYPQFRAVNKTIQRIETGSLPKEKGGVIWHTQGSGKSLTMVWLAQQLKRKFGKPTVLVVTDRKQLDKQIYSTFENCGFPNPIQASDKENLKSLIENNKGQTIMTTIQKFPFFKDVKPHTVSDEIVFVLVDEGHRTQHGLNAADMRIALPNAIFYAYTGTPLMKESKTQRVFGKYIDKYKLSEAEADGATVPIFYSGSKVKLFVENGEDVDTVFNQISKELDEENKAKIKQKHVRPVAIADSPDRIKKIALNIVKHYEESIRPNGFKAMIVVSSRRAAIRYKEVLDETHAPESKIIMTSNNNDKQHGWDKYRLTEHERQQYVEDFKKPIDENPLSILIVVDMLLTGFDAPILQAIYLDKGLRNHTILQAIARVNRPYNETKTGGFIIDYWGNSKNLRDAFELYDDDDIKNSIKPLTDQFQVLDLRYKQVMSFFKDVDHSDRKALLEILTPVDVRTRFENEFKAFSKVMDVLLPEPEAIKYRHDLSFLSGVRAHAKTMFYDEDIELEGYGEKVKKIIDESVRAAEIKGLIAPTRIDPRKFKDILDIFGTNYTRASAIESAGIKIIKEEQEKNPEFYRSLRLRLEEIIEDLKNKNYQDAEKFNSLYEWWDELLSESEKSKSLGFTNVVQFSMFKSLEKEFDSKKSKELTLKIHPEIIKLQVIDWEKPEKENIQKEMRIKIKDILAEVKLEFEQRNKLSQEIVDIYKSRAYE